MSVITEDIFSWKTGKTEGWDFYLKRGCCMDSCGSPFLKRMKSLRYGWKSISYGCCTFLMVLKPLVLTFRLRADASDRARTDTDMSESRSEK